MLAVDPREQVIDLLTETVAPSCLVAAEQASMLAFAFAEIVTNAMKYAHRARRPLR